MCIVQIRLYFYDITVSALIGNFRHESELIELTGKGKAIKMHLSNRFLMKMLISYLAVALIPLLLLIWSYNTGLTKSEELEMAQLTSTLDRVCVAIDSDANKLSSIYQAILGNDDIVGVSRTGNPLTDKQNVWAVLAAQNQLSMIGICDGLFDDIFVYNVNGDYLISTDNIYLKPEFLSAVLAQKYRNATWLDLLLPLMRGEMGYGPKWIALPDANSSSSAFVCIQRMYTGLAHNSAYIAMLVTPGKLESYLSKYADINMVLLDSSGAPVAGNIDYPIDMTGMDCEQDGFTISDAQGNAYLVKTRNTTFAGLRLAAILPYSVIDANVAPIKMTFIIAALLVLLTTLALCLGFAIINTRPIEHILKMLFGVPSIYLPHNMENWHTLDESIQRLINDNYELKRSIKLQSDYMKANLYYELLTDWQGDAAERIVPRLKELGLSIEGEFILISMMFRSEYKSSNPPAVSLTLHAFVKDAFPMSFHITETSEQRFAAFLPISEWDDLAAKLEVIKQRAADMLGLTLICAYDRVPSINDIGHVSWEHARTIELITGSGMAAPSDETAGDSWPGGVYPAKLDTLLTAAIISGDRRQLNAALDHFWHSVLQNGEVPEKQLKLHMEHLRTTIAHSVCKCGNIETDMALNTLRQLRYYNRLDGIKTQLEQIAACVEPVMDCAAQSAGSSLRKARITADILDFIRANFCHADMCLSMLAEHFHLDEGYISSLIKQETGEGFQTYLEMQRIDRACTLLRENWKVKDVATAVGYNSTGNFRRAFSKVTGQSPSLYAEMN